MTDAERRDMSRAVTFARSRRRPRLRSVFLTLAALALVLKVLIPPGFMVAAKDDAPFPLVLCTAQGAVVVDHLPGEPQQADPEHDAPCVFAGHGAGAPAPDLLSQTVVFIGHAAPAVATPDLAPGRGLAAPPPPSTGPPALTI